MVTLSQIILRLVLSMLLSAAIGFEREARHRPAGLRTMTLIGTASTLIMLVSLSFISDSNIDPTRLVAGFLTPIGLLGAGVIIHGRDKNETQGITTAATILMVAGIGLALGLGLYLAAIFATMLTLIVLYVFDYNTIQGFFKKK